MKETFNIRKPYASSLIVQIVPHAFKDDFIKWAIEIDLAAQLFSGYKTCELFQPIEMKSEEWLILLEFDNAENLEKWIESPIRKNLISSIPIEFSNFKIQTLPNGFGAFFSGVNFNKEKNFSEWKVYFIVLLSLYPTVMLLNIWITPVIAPLGFSVSMLLSNAFSVGILQWIVVPMLTKIFLPWLDGPHSRKIWFNLLCLLTILLSLLGLTILFDVTR